ncbi:MAG: hypothetical protein WD184_03270 [Acidimicrobiia bacterium]
MPVSVSIARSPLRLLAYAAFAVPAILLAVDMMAAYRWFPEPAFTESVVGTTINENGESVDVVSRSLTQDGRAQRRRDLVIASALLVGGSGAMIWGLKELVLPTILLKADDEGISVRVDGPARRSRLFPWEEVVEVRSGVIDSEGAPVSVLSIRLRDMGLLPSDPSGAEPDPPWIHLYADEWDRPAHMVAPLLDQRAGRPRVAGADE